MPELLLLCEYATLNGGERSMLATLSGVQMAGFTPVVMAPPHGPLADALAAIGVEVVPFECHPSDADHISQSCLRERLAATIVRRRPALLHANSLAMGRLSGPVAAELALPSLSHLRDIVRPSAQAVADLNRHTRLLAVSEATRVFHVAGGLAAEKVHVVYNGVDLEQFRPRPPTGYLHRELAMPPEAQLIGIIGQIGLRKGLDVFARAMRRIADRLPNVHSLVVGQRYSEKDESRRFERELHDILHDAMGQRAHFLGVRNDVCRLLNELTLLVHPARQEPLGRVLLEAAAAGVPIIATAVGGTPEIFPSEIEAARLVPPDDPIALGNVVLDLFDDDASRQRLAIAARRRAEEQFDIRTAVDNLIRHYLALA